VIRNPIELLWKRTTIMASTSEPSANMEHSQHFTRSQTRLHYKAAGVLPFSFQYGLPVILLGAELAKTGPQGKMYKTMCKHTKLASVTVGCVLHMLHVLAQGSCLPHTLALCCAGRDFGGQREAIDPDSETTASR